MKKQVKNKKPAKKVEEIINHFILVLDASGSMSTLTSTVVRETNKQIDSFKKLAKDTGQETRLSLYKFESDKGTVNLCFDRDINSIEPLCNFTIGDMTPLWDAIGEVYKDICRIPTNYGNHAFVLNILTDGANNQSYTHDPFSIKALINQAPENWTFAAMVPNAHGRSTMLSAGFEPGNILIWETTEKGYTEAFRSFDSGTQSYTTRRAMGAVKTSNLFQTNATNVTPTDVRKASSILKPGTYSTLTVPNFVAAKTWISDFISKSVLGKYRLGKSYYQLVKPEKIQPQKEIILRNKQTKECFYGPYVRQLINLPDYELKVSPGDHGIWDIFVQSTAINRYVVGGTDIITLP